MKYLLTTLLTINSASAWIWNKKDQVQEVCNNNKSSLINQTNVCWEAMGYKNQDLSNVTAIFQPGFWETDYPEIMSFCSEKGNGTFCYRPSSQMNDTCLDMAVVRCPEGIISSCRSNFICNKVMSQNITCDASISSVFNSSFVESGQASCQAIEDVLKLPVAQNVSTTVDQQNNTFTVGSQVFDFPFASTTTVPCTFTCISTLPSGFPQPTEVMSACFNPSLPYDQLIPKSTCVGPYPPGPMTTITETFCANATSTIPVERISTPSNSIESTSVTSEISQCPIIPVSSSMTESSEQQDSTSSNAGGCYSSASEITATSCESEEITSSIEPTSSPGYY